MADTPDGRELSEYFYGRIKVVHIVDQLLVLRAIALYWKCSRSVSPVFSSCFRVSLNFYLTLTSSEMAWTFGYSSLCRLIYYLKSVCGYSVIL
jgi:hypothetical protein